MLFCSIPDGITGLYRGRWCGLSAHIVCATVYSYLLVLLALVSSSNALKLTPYPLGVVVVVY